MSRGPVARPSLVDRVLAVVAAALLGAVLGAVIAAVSAGSSGFAIWVVSIASFVGAAAGVVSFSLAAFAFRLLRAAGRRWTARIVAVAVAAIAAALTVALALNAIKALHLTELTLLAAMTAAALAAAVIAVVETRKLDC